MFRRVTKKEVDIKIGGIEDLVKLYEKNPDPERKFWIDTNNGIVYEKIIVEVG